MHLSALPHDPTSTRPLTQIQQDAEIATARRIVNEACEAAGVKPPARLRIEMNTRFTRRMGDANHALGRIRLSASALWRRATPRKRRNTVIHELAHILTPGDGHGRRWKAMMRRLGEEPQRSHTVNREGLRRGRQRGLRVVDEAATVYSFRVGDVVAIAGDRFGRRGVVAKLGRSRVHVDCGAAGILSASPAILERVEGDDLRAEIRRNVEAATSGRVRTARADRANRDRATFLSRRFLRF